MTAHPHEPESRRTPEQIRASLQHDRSPRNIRAALPLEDLEAFDRQYRDALQRAADDPDLAPLHECVETWWRRAVLKADPDDYARMMERAEEVRRRVELGEPVGGVAWDDAFEARLRSRLATGQ